MSLLRCTRLHQRVCARQQTPRGSPASSALLPGTYRKSRHLSKATALRTRGQEPRVVLGSVFSLRCNNSPLHMPAHTCSQSTPTLSKLTLRKIDVCAQGLQRGT